MPGNSRVFFDSNVLVYAYDRSEPRKSRIASELIQAAWNDHAAVTSFQVLQEFLVVVTRKIETPLPADEAIEICKNLCTWDPVATHRDIFETACDILVRHKLNYWDCAILAQAEWANCEIVYSEDLQSGFKWKSLKVVNPF